MKLRLAKARRARIVMADETTTRSAETSDGGGHRGGGRESESPLQARAAFVENWSWESLVGINRRICAGSGAQHGINSETGGACAAEWEAGRHRELTLAETFDLLFGYHRKAPFLFFNGNTFSFIGRELTLALFSELPPIRKKSLASAVAHYVAGVLPKEALTEMVESLSRVAQLQTGDRVRTLRGSLRGVITRVLEDGRVTWRPDGAASELIGLPETLETETP